MSKPKDAPAADQTSEPVRSGGYVLTENDGWVLDPDDQE